MSTKRAYAFDHHADDDCTGRPGNLRVEVVVTMAILELAIGFFVLAILAAVVGARGIAGMSMEIARLLIIAFIILAIISLVL